MTTPPPPAADHAAINRQIAPINILLELDESEQATLERYGIVHGWLRVEPRKPWTEAERRERMKWALKHMTAAYRERVESEAV